MNITLLIATVAGNLVSVQGPTPAPTPITHPTEPSEIESARTPDQIATLLALARVEGSPEHPELVVPLDLPQEARALGIMARERVYKGICGPEGATASVEDLYAHARRDFETETGTRSSSEFVGIAPRFELVYDQTNPTLIAFYLPTIRSAAQYIADSLDNRVTTRILLDAYDFSTDSNPSNDNAIGTASSTRFTLPWSVYVEGLRASQVREDSALAMGLPTASLPMINSSGGVVDQTQVRVTDAQLRAIFGENVLGPATATTLSFNTRTSWHFFSCNSLPSNRQSLADVAVHEFTHSLGFTSTIDQGGQGWGAPEGLDIARFRFVNLPFSAATFAGNTRIGAGYINEQHFYSSWPNGYVTALESGDSHQPSHLEYRSDFNSKLGIMDPVSAVGRTRCPNFWTRADYQPLDDMGWSVVIPETSGDCNANLVPDLADILIGSSQDVDGDSRPDECESFLPGQGTPFAYLGVHRSVYLTPGLTNLNNFNPDSPDVTLTESGLVPDMSTTATFPNTQTRVIRLSAWMFAPAHDEYALRVRNTSPMQLWVDGSLIGALNRPAIPNYWDAGSWVSPQNFVQLRQGWHRVELLMLCDQSQAELYMMREARNLGGWELVPTLHLRALNFQDCDGNGIHDPLDPDCDGNGVPDACELDCNADGIPDTCQNIGPDQAQYLGVIGEPRVSITYSTCGSDFDTEIALYDMQGMLLSQNDDACGVQSRIVRRLSAGDYYICFGGKGMAFSNNFHVRNDAARNGNCSPGGMLTYTVGNLTRTEPFPSGLYAFARFTIADAIDCPADFNSDGVLNFFDVSAFLSAFASGQPQADFTHDGNFDFFDVSAFLNQFSAGCP
ncbi:MAG: NF038122 family metalloprotease [Phycisphaerales bacterium]|nr:NF038122 family metalloprotease [Phycisphaerales bacterium]